MLAWLKKATGSSEEDEAAAAVAAAKANEPMSDGELSAFQFSATPAARVPVVYSEEYNIGFFGVERLHPFDSAKYQKVYRALTQDRLLLHAAEVHQPVEAPHAVLRRVHPQEYLDSLKNSSNVADIVEMPVGILPNSVVQSSVLKPMRYATAGTLLAADLAQKSMLQNADDAQAQAAAAAAAPAAPPGGAAPAPAANGVRPGWSINLSGGYHHCSAREGGGFCAYGDISLAVLLLSAKHGLQRVMIVDLDAHQGNGHENDKRNGVFRAAAVEVFILDMFNHRIYPRDHAAADVIDCAVRLESGTGDEEYLRLLRAHLAPSLQRFRPQAIIYNAGTDCLAGDRLGQLSLTAAGVAERDRVVFEAALQAQVPVAMLLSGGYQKTNAAVIANSIANLQDQLQLWDVAPDLQAEKERKDKRKKTKGKF